MSIRHTVGGAQNVVTRARTERGQQRGGREPLVVQHQHGRARVPRREHVAPGVLGPARRGQVQVHVARLDADPVHGGQVPHRVADLRVRDQLGQRRGARGEVEQQRVAGPGDALGANAARNSERGRVRMPPRPPRPRRPRSASSRPAPRRTSARRAASVIDVPDLPARHPVRQVGRLQQRDAGMITAPSFIVARMTSHSGATLPSISSTRSPRRHAEPAQPAGHLRRPRRQRPVGQRDVGLVVADDPQRGPVRVLGRDHVEPVERPVELVQRGPGERAPRRVVVVAVARAAGPAPPGTRPSKKSWAYRGSYLPLRGKITPLTAYWSRDRADNRGGPGRTRAGQRTTQAHRRALRPLRGRRPPGRAGCSPCAGTATWRTWPGAGRATSRRGCR